MKKSKCREEKKKKKTRRGMMDMEKTAEAKENLLKRETSVLIKTKLVLLPEDFLVSSKKNYTVYFVFI